MRGLNLTCRLNDPAMIYCLASFLILSLARYNMACILQSQRDYKGAMKKFRECMAIDPSHQPSREALEYLVRPSLNRGFKRESGLCVDTWLTGSGKKEEKKGTGDVEPS